MPHKKLSIDRLKMMMTDPAVPPEVSHLLGLSRPPGKHSRKPTKTNTHPLHPDGWVPWREPRAPLTIDKEITGLLCNPRLVLSKGRQQGDVRWCPYLQGRRAVYGAVLRACDEEWAQTEMRARAKTMLSLAGRAGRASKSLAALIAELAETPIASFISDLRQTSRSAQKAQGRTAGEVRDALLRAGLQMQERLDAFDTYSGKVGKELKKATFQGESWKAGFCFAMARYWFDLFGKVPSSSNDSLFVHLVGAAYDTICDTSDKWDSAVKAATDLHASLPPDLGFARRVALRTE